MKKRSIVLVSLLIFISAGISAYVSIGRCNVNFVYHEYDKMDKEDVCTCILPEVDKKISKFTISIDRVSYNQKWLRFTLSSQGIDSVYGFMEKSEDNKWKLIDYGTQIEDEDMDKYSVPQEIRPDFIRSN